MTMTFADLWDCFRQKDGVAGFAWFTFHKTALLEKLRGREIAISDDLILSIPAECGWATEIDGTGGILVFTDPHQPTLTGAKMGMTMTLRVASVNIQFVKRGVQLQFMVRKGITIPIDVLLEL